MANWTSSDAPVARRIRAYFAPIDRAAQKPVLFDPALEGGFDLDTPPAPWMNLGWIQGFSRSGGSKTAPIMTGILAAALVQVRESLEAQVKFQFQSWSKLTMALATGSQHMNLLAMERDDSLAASTAPAVAVQAGSTAALIALSAQDAGKFTAGVVVAIDSDYSGQTGFVGSPIPGGYLKRPITDPDYIRRVTFNLGLVAQVTSSGLSLAEPLPGGTPGASAKVQEVTGFLDREGGTFIQEWSALFVIEGTQGERVLFHYPRLQSMHSAEEAFVPLAEKSEGGLKRLLLEGKFLALPVVDPLDGERVLCYRSFLPSAASWV